MSDDTAEAPEPRAECRGYETTNRRPRRLTNSWLSRDAMVTPAGIANRAKLLNKGAEKLSLSDECKPGWKTTIPLVGRALERPTDRRYAPVTYDGTHIVLSDTRDANQVQNCSVVVPAPETHGVHYDPERPRYDERGTGRKELV